MSKKTAIPGAALKRRDLVGCRRIVLRLLPACKDEERNYLQTITYQLRSNRSRASLAKEMEPKLMQTIKDSAIQWVIEARAAPVASKPRQTVN